MYFFDHPSHIQGALNAPSRLPIFRVDIG